MIRGNEGDVDRVLVAGATGPTGRHVVDVLGERGYDRAAITRSPDRAAELQSRGVDAVTGDLLDEDDASRAVEGADAAITCVGSPVSAVLRANLPGVAGPGELVDGAGNRNLLRAAEDAGVERFAMLSSLGVGERPSSWMGWLFRLVLGPVPPAKAGAEAAVRESTITHTILRAGALVDVLSPLAVGELRVGRAGAGVWGVVTRRTVAELLVASLSTPDAGDGTFEVACNPLAVGTDAGIDWDR